MSDKYHHHLINPEQCDFSHAAQSMIADLTAERDQLRAELAALRERRPLSAGRELSTALHTKPLLVSWHPESKAMTVSTLGDYFTHTVATAISLWDLLVEYHDHEDMVWERETGRKRPTAPTAQEQDDWLADHPRGGKLTPGLDDLDLEI